MNARIPQRVVGLTVLCGLVFAPSVSTAQTVSTTYQPQTVEEMIAYLYGMISQLQAMLDAGLAEDSGTSGSVGVARPGSARSLDVDTLSAVSIRDDEADLRARIDLNGNDYAYVWFVYGEDDDELDERTSRRRITDNSGDERDIMVNIDDLDEGERYYFRAVAENESGVRYYGSIRSFSTDEEDDDDDDNDDRDRETSSNGDFELSVSDTSVDVGDIIEVEWEIPNDEVATNNWIGLYRVGAADNRYTQWQFLDEDDSGENEFRMNAAGDFEFRLFLGSSYDVEVTSREIEVED